MAEEKVSRKILEDARKRAAEMVEEVKSEARQMEKQAAGEAEAIREKSKLEASEAAKKDRERLMALAKLELRKSLLSAKRTLVDEAFEKAVLSLQSLKKAEYRALVKRLLLKAAEAGDEEVIVSPREDRIDQRFLDSINKELAPRAELRLSQERREMKGGFILRRGRVEVKATFDSLVNGVRDELEMEVAKLLFPP